MFNSSFLWRLYAGFVAVIAICAFVTNLLLSQYIQDNGEISLEQNLLSRANFLRVIALPALETGNISEQNKIKESIAHLDQQVSSRLTIINAEGYVIADSRQEPSRMDNHLQRPEIGLAIKNDVGRAVRFSNTVQQNMRYLALSVKKNDQLIGFVRVALPLKRNSSGTTATDTIHFSWLLALYFNRSFTRFLFC